MGHSRRFRYVCVTSAYPPIATVTRTFWIGSPIDVRQVPISDIARMTSWVEYAPDSAQRASRMLHRPMC